MTSFLCPEHRAHNNDDGKTSLHPAISSGHTDCVAALLQAGADPNTQTKHGTSPLHLASSLIDSTIARLLLEHGAIVNKQSTDGGWIPLHEACRHGLLDTARLLLQRGSVSELTNDGVHSWMRCDWQPIHFAVCNGNVRCVAELIAAGASVNVGGGPDWSSPLLESIHYEQYECAMLLLQHHADIQYVNRVDMFPLLKAVGMTNLSVDFVALLIDYKADVNQFTYSSSLGSQRHHKCPLSEWAMKGKEVDVLKLLLKGGADMALSDSNSLHPSLFHVSNYKDECRLVNFINICHSHNCLNLMTRSNQWQRTIVGELIFHAANWRRNEGYIRNALTIVLAAGASASDPSGVSNISPIKAIVKKQWKEAICILTEGNIWEENELKAALLGSGLGLGQGIRANCIICYLSDATSCV